MVESQLGGRYLMINAAGARLLGYAVEEVVGRTDAELLPAEAAHTFEETDRAVLSHGSIQTREEVAQIMGVERTYLATKGPLRDAKGAMRGIVGIARDITDRKRAEHDLQTLISCLRSAARSLLPDAM